MANKPAMDTGITSDDKLWALLAYVLTPVLPIIILLMADKKDRPFIRAHNIQALIWGAINSVVAIVGSICLLGGSFSDNLIRYEHQSPRSCRAGS